MTFFTIPLGNTLPWYKFTITLSGVIYTLVPRFNSRTGTWFMDIQDPSGNVILAGLPVLIERNITGQYHYLAIPPGVFVASDDTGQGIEAGQYSFGINNTLWYVTNP